MWWGTLWLSAVLVATISAQIYQGPNTIEHDPVKVQPIPKEVIPELDLGTTKHTTVVVRATEDEENSESLCEDEDDCSDTEEVQTTTISPNTSDEEDEVISTTPGVDSESSDSSLGGTSDDNTGSNDSQDKDGSENKDLIVDTTSGLIQGFIWQGNERIISYIDIPYGTFKHPFQAARSAKCWGPNVHVVKEHDKRCPQLYNNEYVGNTDCLTLSIFRPQEADGASVLFHIHADNFNTGSGDPSIYGPEYLVSNGIILVLPNYRLGPLGFLCVQNETAPGNMALKDLSLALNWIKDNIAAFGGDPDNIAVSGDGKSGALAGFLALSPMSKGYINKVISESGSFLSYWALDRDPTATVKKLLDSLPEADNLQSKADVSFGQYTIKAIVEAARDIEFKPCVETIKENAFLSEVPYVTITTENFENVNFLLGSALYAGVHEALHQTDESIKKLNEDFALLLPNDLKFSTTSLRNRAGGQVKEQYFGDEAISLADKKHLSLCFTDVGYLGPGIRSARLLVAANATVYFYEFAYVGTMNRVLESIGSPVEGAVRGDIVGYLFTQDGVEPAEESADSKMVESLIKMWTNFLKSGSPATNSIEWNKFEKTDQDKEEWLLIDSQPTMKKGLHVDRLSLWTEMYENHFIDNDGHQLSPSVYIVLIFQLIFWFGFCRNASHVF